MSQEEPPKTLNEFIDKYHYLLASMGVFGGLTALFTQLEGGQYLVFITFFIFLVLGWELYTKFPKWREGAINLFVFRVLTVVLSIGVAGYLAYFYLSYFILASIYIGIAVLFVFQSIFAPKVTNYLRTHEKTSTLVAIILTGVITFAVFFFALLILALIFYLLGIPIPTPNGT